MATLQQLRRKFSASKVDAPPEAWEGVLIGLGREKPLNSGVFRLEMGSPSRAIDAFVHGRAHWKGKRISELALLGAKGYLRELYVEAKRTGWQEIMQLIAHHLGETETEIMLGRIPSDQE